MSVHDQEKKHCERDELSDLKPFASFLRFTGTECTNKREAFERLLKNHSAVGKGEIRAQQDTLFEPLDEMHKNQTQPREDLRKS